VTRLASTSEVGAARAPTHDHHVNPWLVLVYMAQFILVLDATIVNVALPSIQQDLEVSHGDLQWVAYTLVLGGFLLLGGRS
jgi:MFS family permease